MFIVLLFSILAFAAGALLGWWYERSRMAPERANLESSVRTLRSQWTEARDLLETARLEAAKQQVAIARLEERNLAEKSSLEEMRANLPHTFKSLASEVLQEKSREFAERNQVSLNQVLSPLSTRLEEFQKKIEEVYREQVKGDATLRQQVNLLVASTTKVSVEANSLATALKGSTKIQGNWGELVLERILENAGLRRGHEYEAQEGYLSKDGRRGHPDIVIHLPGGRHLVIDSKVSLAAYEVHSNAGEEAARTAAANDHLTAVRNHIRGLSEKNYQTLYGLKSLDFVIMFLPIEPAFILALSHDERLWEQAWQKNVLLVSPSSLLFVLRTVSYLWRQEQQERNVEEIARRGAELYNKLSGFVEDLTLVGKRLGDAQQSYENAVSKLRTGRGNVIRQAELLKALGVKPSKQLPQDMVELAQQETLALGQNGDDEA